jgi:hypothetical protein
MGKLIIYAGLALVIIGAIVQFAPWAVSWFGKLPGDIRIQGEKGGVFIPLTSMIIISVVLTIIVNLLKR